MSTNIPFIPQEGITQSILSAIQLANQHSAQQTEADQRAAQLRQQQSQVDSENALRSAQVSDLNQKAKLQQAMLDSQARAATFVNGSPAPAAQPTSMGPTLSDTAPMFSIPPSNSQALIAKLTGQQIPSPADATAGKLSLPGIASTPADTSDLPSWLSTNHPQAIFDSIPSTDDPTQSRLPTAPGHPDVTFNPPGAPSGTPAQFYSNDLNGHVAKIADDLDLSKSERAELSAAADTVKQAYNSNPEKGVQMAPIDEAIKNLMIGKRDLSSTVTPSSTPGLNLVTYRSKADGAFAYAAYEKDTTHTVNIPDAGSSTGVAAQTLDSQNRIVNNPLVQNVIDTSYQVTPKDIFKENQDNYRSQLAKQTSTSDAEGRAGVSALEKQGETWNQFVATRDTLKKSIDLARNGNELANSVAGLQTTLFITTAEGVKRVNETELASVTGSGSAARQINAKLDKVGTGQIPESLRTEMDNLVDSYSQAKYNAYKNATDYTIKLHGLNPATTPVLGPDGTIATQGQVTVTDPNGGSHTFPDQAHADAFKKLAGIS